MKRRGGFRGFRSTTQVILDGITVPFLLSLCVVSVGAWVLQLPERLGWPIFFLVPLLATVIEEIWNRLVEKKDASYR